MRPHQPVGEAVAVANRITQRKARRLAGLPKLLAHLQEARQVGRRRLVADLVHRGFAPHQRPRRAAEGQADPVVGAVALAVLLADEHPAAVFATEILRDVGQFHELVGVDMRRIAEADDQVGTGAGVGGDGGLLVDVLPPHEVHAHLHAGLLGEAGAVGAEHLLVRRNEADGTQHPQRGPVLDGQARRRHTRRRLDARLRVDISSGRERGHAGARPENAATRDDVRHVPSPCLPLTG